MLYATHAQVHLDHIVANLRAVRERVGDRAVLLAIKGDAYGHGAVPVAQAVTEAGAADWFGVATVPEGVELREAGITAPILKLSHALDEELDTAVRAGLVLTVVSADTVVAAERAAAAAGVTSRGGPVWFRRPRVARADHVRRGRACRGAGRGR
ncbi:MAG TPA: alanine racemase [Propionibacteriaceae bacterium]|nr:alanine racemase [Propionibacteriaceae bacterium]